MCLRGIVSRLENPSLKDVLQGMYDNANFYGYATRKNKKYYSMQISKIAKRAGIELTYNCPA
jgi:hypothetical protein